jgi:pimeloyl-ACP methyl ester carboxylesterase
MESGKAQTALFRKCTDSPIERLAMLEFLTLLPLLLGPPGPVETNPIVTPAKFQASFESSLAGKLAIPDNIKEGSLRYRYVFIGGFLNEGMSQYFKQNARELRALGVPRAAIHYIYPSSHESVAGNADLVRGDFQKIASEGPEKLVVIAHSRGACDALAFALQNPEFVANRVEALFLVQGPFGGTGVADYVTGEGPPIDSLMPFPHRVVGLALGRVEETRLAHGKHGGITALTRRASRAYWEMALKENQAAIKVVGPKTFYVTAKTKPSHLGLFLKSTAFYLGAHFGPNDGMVALDDQTVAGLGTVLAVLDAGHTDLTHRFPSALPNRRLRRALIDAIVMAVGRPVTVKVAASRTH